MIKHFGWKEYKEGMEVKASEKVTTLFKLIKGEGVETDFIAPGLAYTNTLEPFPKWVERLHSKEYTRKKRGA